MKKFLFTCIALVSAIAAWAEPVTLAQARQLAQAYMKQGVQPRALKHKAVRQADEQQQPLYVFSRGEGEGFVIVSGDDRLPAIIGFTESGDFDENDMPEALRDMLDYYTEAAQRLDESASTEAVAPRKASGTRDLPILMTSHHHQSWPYNNKCPYIKETTNRAVTGCVATAASQIIYYWRRDLDDRTKYDTPTYGYGDAPVTESIPSGTPLKWDLMFDSYSSSDPAESIDAIATFVACVGTSAWLTYGSSTSGQIDNCRQVFSGQFGMNGGTTVWKSSYNQSNWEKLIIQDLEAGYPILYSGVHPSNGGHAVVIDGYRLRDNLFHFNFGWGGQGDGYFTVDDADGMNGFNGSQGMVRQIYPKKYRIEGQFIDTPDSIVSRVENTVRVRVTNNSTIPQTGISLYCVTNATVSGSPVASDKETIIGVGETVDLTLNFSTTITSNCNLLLTDANKSILARVSGIPTIASVPALTLKGMTADDGNTSETLTVGDETIRVRQIYNTKKANITATFTNAATATRCTPSVQGVIDVLKDGIFERSTTKTKKNVTFEPGATEDIVYDLSALTDGEVYKFYLAGTASTNKSYPVAIDTPDSVVYFRLMGRNLAIENTEDDAEVRLTGNYNPTAFTALATDKNVCRYDLTAVSGVQLPIVASNPNALFYVSADAGVSGTNIVVDGVAQSLELTPGHDFAPRGDFHAMTAIYHAETAPGRFGSMLLPFDAPTPSGMFARKVNELKTSYLQDVDSCNLTLSSGTPYIILTAGPVDVVAQNVTVSTEVPSQGTDSLRGTWKNLTATETQYVLDEADTQYFSLATGQTIPALTAYLEYTRKVRATSYPYNQKDKKAIQLSQQIALARTDYDTYASQARNRFAEALLAAISEACDTLRTQPVTSLQTAQITALTMAQEALLADANRIAENGYEERTSYIQNPSFETGSLLKWTGTSATVNRITSSHSLFMSGADGNVVVRLNSGGSVVQQLTGMENGFYLLEAQVAADYDKHIALFADKDTVTVESAEFGPMYMAKASLENIEVTDGTLTIGAQSVDGWAKVDNFRLYLMQSTDGIGGVQPCDHSARVARPGVYDLTGRKVGQTLDGQKRGFYIVDGKKIIVTE